MKINDPILIPMQKHIEPLNMNGLSGRVLSLDAPKGKKREILMIYGMHASLERMFGLAESANEYGAVTMPDLPGFGGMDSFYTIGMKPTIDTLADYLASFIKLRYKKRKITIIGMSLGFVIVTRMLQRYPHLVKQVDLLISIVGFAHKYDVHLPRYRYYFYRFTAGLFTGKIGSTLFYNTALYPPIIRAVYSKTHNAKKKFEGLSKHDKKSATEFEVDLWRCNDVRTYMKMTVAALTLNNCERQVDLPVHHVSVAGDQYFDNTVVEQHMRIIYTDFTEHVAVMNNHAPSILATKEEASPLIPKSIRKLMKKTTK